MNGGGETGEPLAPCADAMRYKTGANATSATGIPGDLGSKSEVCSAVADRTLCVADEEAPFPEDVDAPTPEEWAEAFPDPFESQPVLALGGVGRIEEVEI